MRCQPCSAATPDPAWHQAHLHEIVHQYRLSGEHLSARPERRHVAALGLDWGRRARTAAAFSEATQILDWACGLLGTEDAHDAHALAFPLHLQAA